MPFSDEVLAGDSLTTIQVNYRWRSLIVHALESYYSPPDGSEISLDNHDKYVDFLEDLYDDD